MNLRTRNGGERVDQDVPPETPESAAALLPVAAVVLALALAAIVALVLTLLKG